MNDADLRREHDVGSIIGLAYRVYASQFRPMFAIALTTVPIGMLMGVVQQRWESDSAQAVAALLQIPNWLVTLVAASALIFAVNDVAGGTPADFGRALDTAFARLGAIISTALLHTALLIVSLGAFPFLALWWLVRGEATVDGRREWWLVLVPGALFVYLAVRWAFENAAVMIPRRQNWSALDDSATAVRSRWWRTAGALLLIGLIGAGPLLIVSGIASFAAPLIAATLTSLSAAVALPFLMAAQTLLYYDLKARVGAEGSIGATRVL